jgi:hypothetical protein
MSKGNVRRWENPPKVTGKSTNDGSSKNVKTIGDYVSNLSEKNSAIHRAGFLHFLQAIVGNNVEANLNNGNKINGIFHTSTPFQGMDFQFAIKGCKNVDGKEIKDSDLGATVIVPSSNLSYLTINGKIELNRNGGSNELRTDGAIRGASIKHLEGRELQAATSWLGSETSATMANHNNKTSWNQFEANKKLFNVQSSYDENIYTKKLDKNSLSKAEMDKADRIAREIESTTSDNVHIKEERGQQQEREIDEEDMYGGVIRDSSTSPSKKDNDTNDKERGVWSRGHTTNKVTNASSSNDKKQSNNGKVKKDDKTGNKANSTAPPPGIPISTEQDKTSDLSVEKDKDNKIEEEINKDKKDEDKKEVKTPTKLNASAKPFSFNPNAKSFEFKPPAPPVPVDNNVQQQLPPNGQYYQNQMPIHMQQQYNPQYPQQIPIVPQEQIGPDGQILRHPVFTSPYGYAPGPVIVQGGAPQQMMYQVPPPLHQQHMMPMNPYMQQQPVAAPYMQHQNMGGRGNSGRGGRGGGGRGNQWQSPNQGGFVPIPSGQTPPKQQVETPSSPPIETDEK